MATIRLAESQQIVRQAYSHAYNTPLREKVVYSVSIFPDGRVVIQGRGPQAREGARHQRPHLYGAGAGWPYRYSRQNAPWEGEYRRCPAWILT